MSQIIFTLNIQFYDTTLIEDNNFMSKQPKMI